jgi:hypothetical protein
MPKITCSPLYEDHRPKINAVILLDMGERGWEKYGKGRNPQT